MRAPLTAYYMFGNEALQQRRKTIVGWQLSKQFQLDRLNLAAKTFFFANFNFQLISYYWSIAPFISSTYFLIFCIFQMQALKLKTIKILSILCNKNIWTRTNFYVLMFSPYVRYSEIQRDSEKICFETIFLHISDFAGSIKQNMFIISEKNFK